MAERDPKATDPAAHQPTKADTEADVSTDATRGGAGRERRGKEADER